MSTTSGRRQTPCEEPYTTRFRRMLSQQQARRVPVVYVGRRRRPLLGREDFPFTSLSMLVILASLFLLSMHLGGWTWSSWTYAFSLGVAVPLVAIEVKRRAVITGAAILLLSGTAIIAAGLPQYFGYSTSVFSWYDLTAHYLGALALTVLLWSVLCWTRAADGRADDSRLWLIFAVAAMLGACIVFELLEFATDAMMGWANFHAGIDTIGDIIFDVAGVATATIVIARHGVTAIKRPFWYAEAVPA